MSDTGSNEEYQDWAAYFLPRAEGGDPDAQIAVGWAYAGGKKGMPKDMKKSEEWFRRAEKSVGELAMFHLVRMLHVQRDIRIDAVFHERAHWDLGAIYAVYGRSLMLRGDITNAQKHLVEGKNRGNFYSDLLLHRLTYPGVWRILMYFREVAIIVKFMRVWWKDENHPSVL